MVTMKDVAKAAGVSIKTVSRVVNNSAEVNEETRQHVQNVIKDLGFRPSALAKRLVHGKSNTVGVVIPQSVRYIFSHIYFNEILKGIAEILSNNKLDMLVHLALDENPYAELYLQCRVDGLILLSIPFDDPHLAGLLDSTVPCVFTCRITEGSSPVHSVDTDFAGATEDCVQHLVSLGHRRIGLLAGPSNLIAVRLRVHGYRQALVRYALPVQEELIVYGGFSFEAGKQLAQDLMQKDQPPTALICGDDMIALGAIQGLRELGYSIPDDISVIGFDDIILAQYAVPPLTTVRQDAYRKGYLAAETLVQLMADSTDTEPMQCILDTELIVRGSTGAIK